MKYRKSGFDALARATGIRNIHRARRTLRHAEKAFRDRGARLFSATPAVNADCLVFFGGLRESLVRVPVSGLEIVENAGSARAIGEIVGIRLDEFIRIREAA